MPEETTQPIVVKETAGLGKLNLRDLILGTVVAAIGAAITIITESISGGFEAIDWKNVGIVAATAGGAYLLKNLATPQKTIAFAQKEEVKITEKSTGDTLVADAPKVK